MTPLTESGAATSPTIGISPILSMLTHHVMLIDSYTSLSAAIDDLHKVMMFLKNLHSWMKLGLALGLLYPSLEKIEKENDMIDDCKMKMLAAWLQKQDKVAKEGLPSWSVLQTALKEIGVNDLADKISVVGQL